MLGSVRVARRLALGATVGLLVTVPGPAHAQIGQATVVGENPEIGLIPPAEHCVNAIPYVCAAEPGIKTYLDLPLLAGRGVKK